MQKKAGVKFYGVVAIQNWLEENKRVFRLSPEGYIGGVLILLFINLFYFSEEFRKSLEAMRSRVLCRAAVKIQAMARMFLAKKHWTQLKFSLQQAQLQGAAQQSLLK